MSTKARINWIVSYPKSGNTWVRIFLNNLLGLGEEPADINNIRFTSIASARDIMDQIAGFETSDLSYDELDMLRPRIYEYLSFNSPKDLYFKVHDAYVTNGENEYIFPKNVTKSCIYLIRNPLDVAVSYANHNNCKVGWAIKVMGKKDHLLCGGNTSITTQIRQKLLSWSQHVQTWTDQKDLNTLVIRYEDLVQDSMGGFAEAVKFLNLKKSRKEIKAAVEYCDFEKLREQEMKNGFKEKPMHADSFFRKGKVGDWKGKISPAEVKKIVKDHSIIMKRFGYLSNSGEILMP